MARMTDQTMDEHGTWDIGAGGKYVTFIIAAVFWII